MNTANKKREDPEKIWEDVSLDGDFNDSFVCRCRWLQCRWFHITFYAPGELERWREEMVNLWWWKTMPLATFKMILLVEDFHRDFTTLLGWSFTSTPRRRWRSRASWRGQRRTSTTTWRRIHCYGRFDFLLGVAWSEINLILCDAVGNDRGDDGDVRDIDDDDKRVAPRQCREEGKSWHPHPEPFEDDCHWDWFDHTAGLDGFLRGSGLIFFFWLSLHTWSSRAQWARRGGVRPFWGQIFLLATVA